MRGPHWGLPSTVVFRVHHTGSCSSAFDVEVRVHLHQPELQAAPCGRLPVRSLSHLFVTEAPAEFLGLLLSDRDRDGCWLLHNNAARDVSSLEPPILLIEALPHRRY